ncbi:hypothetical protein C2845_PM07G33130 [Panicum miliaceum]|uniref:Uncharacterized protein n=1 Tax=Panicum miliaceum TaxID=4540 RepID=A0A3L6SK33_PANMI|nr:hypothetical protein C2845_PM07G33130 [Panicum miliaceum]
MAPAAPCRGPVAEGVTGPCAAACASTRRSPASPPPSRRGWGRHEQERVAAAAKVGEQQDLVADLLALPMPTVAAVVDGRRWQNRHRGHQIRTWGPGSGRSSAAGAAAARPAAGSPRLLQWPRPPGEGEDRCCPAAAVLVGRTGFRRRRGDGEGGGGGGGGGWLRRRVRRGGPPVPSDAEGDAGGRNLLSEFISCMLSWVEFFLCLYLKKRYVL